MKVLLLHSRKTKGGTQRIQQLLEPEIEVDFMSDRPADMSKYDGVVLHNRIDVNSTEPTVCYPCGTPAQRMIDSPESLARVVESKPRAIWTNSHTATALLRPLFPDSIPVKYMAKPLPLTIPDKCPPFPDEKRILWYWPSTWMYTRNLKKPIARLVKEVADEGIKISIISTSKSPTQCSFIKHPNVSVLGRIDIPKEIHEYLGMVRVTEGLDFGRITYQLLAYGRWCLYVGMNEPHVICAQSMDRVPELVRAFVDQRDGWEVEEKRKYIAENFSEEILRKRWQQEVLNVFGS